MVYFLGNLSGLFFTALLISRVATPYNCATSRSISTEATFLIIETFAKLRALQTTVVSASSATGDKKNSLLKKSGELMADLLDQDMTETESETTFELNFAVLKLKHTTKRKKEPDATQK